MKSDYRRRQKNLAHTEGRPVAAAATADLGQTANNTATPQLGALPRVDPMSFLLDTLLYAHRKEHVNQSDAGGSAPWLRLSRLPGQPCHVMMDICVDQRPQCVNPKHRGRREFSDIERQRSDTAKELIRVRSCDTTHVFFFLIAIGRKELRNADRLSTWFGSKTRNWSWRPLKSCSVFVSFFCSLSRAQFTIPDGVQHQMRDVDAVLSGCLTPSIRWKAPAAPPSEESQSATVRCSYPILGPRTRPSPERLEFSLRPGQDARPSSMQLKIPCSHPIAASIWSNRRNRGTV